MQGGSKEIIGQYPDGIFFYANAHDRNNPEIVKKLQAALPGYLVIPTYSHPFPADLGVQIGDSFYGSDWGVVYIAGELSDAHLYNKVKFNLPKIGIPPQIGGEQVQVAQSNVRVFGQELSSEEQLMYKRNYIRTIIPTGLNYARQQLATQGYSEWLYSGHIDLLVTGFVRRDGRVSYYADELLLNTCKQLGVAPRLPNVKPVPNDLVKRGACNIKYMGNTAIVPTVDTIGPIARELRQNGYKIVELGPTHEVADGGGVKCRALDLRWRK